MNPKVLSLAVMAGMQFLLFYNSGCSKKAPPLGDSRTAISADESIHSKYTARFLRELNAADPLKAIKLVEESSDDELYRCFNAIFAGTTENHHLLGKAFNLWANKSPKSAATWARDNLTVRDGKFAFIEIAALLWCDQDFDSALKWLITLSDLETDEPLAFKALHHLSRSNPQRAYEYAKQMGKLGKKSYGYIFEQWVLIDPKMAFVTMGQEMQAQKAYLQALKLWAKSDASSVVEWVLKTDKKAVLTLVEASPNNVRGFLDALYISDEYRSNSSDAHAGFFHILATWASDNPEAVKSWLSNIANPEEKLRLVQSLLSNKLYGKNDELYSWKLPIASSIDDPKIRDALLGSIIVEWARQDPEDALKWAKNNGNKSLQNIASTATIGFIAKNDIDMAMEIVNGLEDPQQKSDAFRELVYGWSTTDPAAAAQWMWGNRHKENDERGFAEYQLVNYSAQLWAHAEPENAISWVNSANVTGEILDTVVNTIIREQKFKAAEQILSSLKDPSALEKAYSALGRYLFMVDSTIGRDWINKSPLSDNVKKSLLEN